MHRELFALLNTSDSDAPLISTDYAITSQNSYKQNRANLSIKKPRRWDIVEFTNSARKDDLILKHWQRADVTPADYSFAKFNHKIDGHIPKYDDTQYNTLLICDQWTREETDHLMHLCTRFDLRFIVIHDRWDRIRFKTERSVEDLKERYYFVYNQLAKNQSFRSLDPPKEKIFDIQNERKRKEQLIKLYNRTREQIEEEQNLLQELRKFEQKRKDREKKTQDLQRTLSDQNRSGHEGHHRRSDSGAPASVGRPSGSGMRGMPGRRPGRGVGRPSRESLSHAALNTSTSSTSSHIFGTAASLLEANTLTIKFPDFKTSGASLRSQRLKLPTSLGNKKMKGLEGMLSELKIDLYPMPTESICQAFNELRGDLLLLYELKMSFESTKFEINSIKDQIKTLKPDFSAETLEQSITSQDSSTRDISDVIDTNAANTPGRKRKAALEQSNVLRKLKRTL